jgi:hypothetical protein
MRNPYHIIGVVKPNLISVFVYLTLTSIFLSGCFIFEPDEYTYYRIRIDSMYAPDSIPSTSNLEIRFWGYIGDDSCYSFSHFQALQQQNELDVTLWSKHHYVYRQTCPSANIRIENVVFRVFGLSPPSMRIRVHQPNGDILVRDVVVY